MRKSVVCLLPLLLIFFVNCGGGSGGGSDTGGKSPAELIVGKWQNSKGKGAVSSQDIFEFNSDGTVSRTVRGKLGGLSSGGTVEGEYMIEGNKITITYPPMDTDDEESAGEEEYAEEEDKTYTYTFKFLDQNRLQLTEDDDFDTVYIRIK
jgi:uncharacterized protein (TIGR03066 family)